MAPLTHLLSDRLLVASDRFELIAAVDIRASARHELAERYPGVQIYDNHRRMFDEAQTDIVCVSTWPPSHHGVVMDVLDTEITGLLCEKPLAHGWAQGREILDAVRARALPMVTPHGLLRSRHAEEILERVHRGEIGELELVEIECARWDIINAGIHWLNFFVNLVPDDPSAWVMSLSEASTRTYRDGMQVETTAITYVQTVRGVRCVMHTGDEVETRRPGKGTVFRLVGTEGALEFWAWESAYRLQNGAHLQSMVFDVPRYPETAHQRYLEELAQQMDTGLRDYAVPESSLAALELCEAAYLSSAHRAKVNLPLSGWTPAGEPDWRPGEPYSGEGGGRNGRKL